MGNNIDLITKQYLEVLNDFKLWEVCVCGPPGLPAKPGWSRLFTIIKHFTVYLF